MKTAKKRTGMTKEENELQVKELNRQGKPWIPKAKLMENKDIPEKSL